MCEALPYQQSAGKDRCRPGSTKGGGERGKIGRKEKRIKGRGVEGRGGEGRPGEFTHAVPPGVQSAHCLEDHRSQMKHDKGSDRKWEKEVTAGASS